MADIGYAPPPELMDRLIHGPESGILDLSDDTFKVNSSQFLPYCGRSDVRVGVEVDVFDDYEELDESNNIEMDGEGFLTISSCPDSKSMIIFSNHILAEILNPSLFNI